MTTIDSLSAVFGERGLAQFLAHAWGRTFLHLAGVRGRFANLLPWDALNTILREHQFEAGRLRLTRDGTTLPPADYVRGGRADPVRLTDHLRDGATLNLNRVHELYEPIAVLAESFERVFRETVNVNLYAGWRTSRGFDVHWDGHDVFVLQIAGRKRWSIYGTSLPYPVRDEDQETKAEPPPEAVWTHVLEDGDLLYMPRGCWHLAVPMDEPSLHLSFGVRRQTGLDLIRWLTKQLYALESFRADLPRHAQAEQRSVHSQRLKQELMAVWTPTLLDEFFADHDARAETRPGFGLPWTALPACLPPADDAVVRLTAPRARVDCGAGGTIQLVAGGRRLTFAAGAAAVVHRLAPGEECSIMELVQRAPNMTGDQVRALVAKMVRQGVVTLVSPGSAAVTPSARRGAPSYAGENPPDALGEREAVSLSLRPPV